MGRHHKFVTAGTPKCVSGTGAVRCAGRWLKETREYNAHQEGLVIACGVCKIGTGPSPGPETNQLISSSWQTAPVDVDAYDIATCSAPLRL